MCPGISSGIETPMADYYNPLSIHAWVNYLSSAKMQNVQPEAHEKNL